MMPITSTTPPKRQGEASCEGFTLVELLLVIAIFAVLLAIILPIGARILAMVRGLQCQSNLRNIHRGFCLYVRDAGGAYPPMRSAGRNGPLLERIARKEGLTVSEASMAGGYHWSLILWPYHRDMNLYVCPNDPNADRVPALSPEEVKPGSPFLDAPPESYGLNTLLFRSAPALRGLAGASWGLRPGDYMSPMTFTTEVDQRKKIPQLGRRVLMFCGTAGFTVGHQSNEAWRDAGRAERFEWHPVPGAKAFEDADGSGSYYLFFDGRAEYRRDFPSRYEWALDLDK